MKTVSVEEFKTNFSKMLERVLAGEEIGILYGKKKEIVAKLVPQKAGKRSKREIGMLKGKVEFGPDFKMTEEEFLYVFSLKNGRDYK